MGGIAEGPGMSLIIAIFCAILEEIGIPAVEDWAPIMETTQ